MSGAFSSTAFDTNAFDTNAWDFGTGPTPTTTVGGHFAGRKKRHHERDFTEELSAKHRLREQIREAIDGPHAEVVQAAISEYIRPQRSDARALSLDERINWDAIYQNLERVELTVLTHIAMAEDDEDEDLLLLNG